jgi:hypothetical protein
MEILTLKKPLGKLKKKTELGKVSKLEEFTFCITFFIYGKSPMS